MSDGTSTWTYTYDANGMRTKRTDGTTTYTYTYNGSQLTYLTIEKNGTVNKMYFVYDADGPVAINSNGTTYYYVKNAQGDIIAIVNKAGTAVVTYTYDAWGNLLSIDGDYKNGLGLRNPLRYRGYVYDTETQMYYLQSRYYDPAVGRFINTDAFVSTGQGILGCNMFTYCGNNPVAMCDSTGTVASYACYRDDPFWDMFSQMSGGGGSAGGAVGAVVVGATTGVIMGAAVIAATAKPAEEEQTETDAIAIAQTSGSHHQEYFPANPFQFMPRGLVIHVCVEPNAGSNGGVIKWEIPGTKIAIFEWNQDYEYGPHYHVLLPGWKNKHMDPHHYKPGEPVPEPWNTTFFGG